MPIKSLKHSLSSLKLAKKVTSALFKDSNLSLLISRYFDSESPNNSFINLNTNTSTNSIYYETIYNLILTNKYSNKKINAIALKFQKILSLEIQKDTIQRMLQGKYADHIRNTGGNYEIFPTELSCKYCDKNFYMDSTQNPTSILNINLLPTITTLWHHTRLLENLGNIGELLDNPFKPDSNHIAEYIEPLNLIIVFNGNHSTNVGLYESCSTIKSFSSYDISHWFDSIYYDPQSNAFRHLKCGEKLFPNPLFHENIGYIYEISRLLYQNRIS